MSEFSSDAEPDLKDELRQVQPLPAPVSPVSAVPSLRQVELPSSYLAPAVPIASSTVASVRSSGTMDAFPTYAGLSGPDLPTPGRSSDAPGYIPMTSPVTPQRPEGSLSFLGLVQRNSVERGFVVFTNFYGGFIFTDPSWIRISWVPDWHSWGKKIMSEKKNGHQMLPVKLNNDYNFLNKTLRDLIMVENYMFSISRNTMEHIMNS